MATPKGPTPMTSSGFGHGMLATSDRRSRIWRSDPSAPCSLKRQLSGSASLSGWKVVITASVIFGQVGSGCEQSTATAYHFVGCVPRSARVPVMRPVSAEANIVAVAASMTASHPADRLPAPAKGKARWKAPSLSLRRKTVAVDGFCGSTLNDKRGSKFAGSRSICCVVASTQNVPSRAARLKMHTGHFTVRCDSCSVGCVTVTSGAGPRPGRGNIEKGLLKREPMDPCWST
mmetsp:Transcript_20367/g.32601  ORF Transcript_20367/g.32601 Transcript_20367/m.32601 type:complete len:232 (+) Transcript_20367:299-994(+)